MRHLKPNEIRGRRVAKSAAIEYNTGMPRSLLTSYNTGDVAVHARNIGVDDNAAIDLMVADRILPMYEANYVDIYESDCNHPGSAYGWSEKTCAMFLSFMQSECIKEFRMQA